MYLFAGQSNMVGYGAHTHELATVDKSLMKPGKNIQFFGPHDDDASRWGPLVPPTEFREGTYASSFGPEVSAARSLSHLHLGAPIAVIKCSHGNTNLYHQWSPSGNMYYTQLIARVRNAISLLKSDTHQPVRIAGMFWMQGESDSDSVAHAQAYGANLKSFIAAVRHDLRVPHMPFVIGRISDIRFIVKNYRYSNIVRDQEQKVADADPYTFMVSTDGLQHDSSSAVHYSTRGTVDLGYRFVRSYFSL